LANRCTLKKPERISAQKEIDRLFTQGDVFISYPLRIVYLKQKPFSGVPVSILVSVSKKKFKRAVKRNRMKRLMREAYRLNKSSLVDYCREKEIGFLIAFLFIGNELFEWGTIEKAMQKAIDMIKEKSE